MLRRRWPVCDVILAPSAVQGSEAPAQLVEALYSLYEIELDVIIVARGGGSIEDLWAFNDEAVARAIHAAPVPVITGVGHETDTTLVDYVADLRAATPSVAAEKATPDIAGLREDVAVLRDRLWDGLAATLAEGQSRLDAQLRSLARRSPQVLLDSDRLHVDQLLARLERAAGRQLEQRRGGFAVARAQLAALSPYATLARGYAVVRRPNGQVIRSAQQVDTDDQLLIELQDGTLSATITER